jgi:glucose/mannose-6-phosphate isomerase
MITKSNILFYDNYNMFSVISEFASQIEDAVRIGNEINVPSYASEFNKIIISGMGGSAIGGDLIRSYLLYDLKIPLLINRNYKLPAFADSDTLVIISSYSGQTEETISAFHDAVNKNCKIITLSSGGSISALSQEYNCLNIRIPTGFQPRCALAYSFFTLFILFSKLNLYNINYKHITDTVNLINNKSANYINYQNTENIALNIAEYLYSKIPVIYSSNDLLDSVNLRWRNQIQENAKSLCFGNFFPEMNHNELVGWQENMDFLQNLAVIYLQDREDNPKIKLRQSITKNIIAPYRAVDIEIESEGNSKLERIFDLIYLGDWVSFYLAILYKTDPTPVEKINILKNKLKEI